VRTDTREVAAILRRLEVAENAGYADDIGQMLAEDAVIMVPDLPIQEGKAACAGFVREVLAGLLERFTRRITYVSAEVRVVGDFAFDRGSFWLTVSPKSGGDTTRETGKYLFLYSRTSGGSWKIARAIVSLDERDGDESGELKGRR
jgi:ketosteroid isomerase-like protein